MKNKLSYGAIGALVILTGCGVQKIDASQNINKSGLLDYNISCSFNEWNQTNECFTMARSNGKIVAAELPTVDKKNIEVIK